MPLSKLLTNLHSKFLLNHFSGLNKITIPGHLRCGPYGSVKEGEDFTGGAQGGLGLIWAARVELGSSGLVRRRRWEGVEEVVTAEMEPPRSCDPTITGGEAPVTGGGGAMQVSGCKLRAINHGISQNRDVLG